MESFPAGLEQVPLEAERLRDVLELDMWAFPVAESIEDLLEVPCSLQWDRTFGVVDPVHPEQLVGLHSSYAFGQCPVPGGRLPAAGLTWVGVHPQWRRRGILTAMIESHFRHCLERGEPVSILTASEPAIYGRFGYGLASQQVGLKLKRRAELRPVPGSEALRIRLESLSRERHADLIAALHTSVARPGWVTRESAELQASYLCDAPVFRSGAETARILVVERDGEPVGYARFRRKEEWDEGNACASVQVAEPVATSPAVTHAIWSCLLDLDLVSEVTVSGLAPDDPLLNLLVDLRAAKPTLQDRLWTRIIDLPAALAGRQYQADLDVVLAVTDSLIPANAGRWRVTASGFGPASVAPTQEPAEIAIDVRELGSAYLGGTSLFELATAGQLTELVPGTLSRASVAFGWPQAPACSWVF